MLATRITSTSIPITVIKETGPAIIFVSRKPDFVDSCIKFSMHGCGALIGGGILFALENYLSSKNGVSTSKNFVPENLTIALLGIGVVWGGLTKLAITFNDVRHTANFYIAFEQQKALIEEVRKNQ